MLNQIHYQKSPNFKKRFQDLKWEQRKTSILEKSEGLLLNYVIELNSNKLIAYCISTISKGCNEVGEIDSIYVIEEYRKKGIGKQLVDEATRWFDLKNVKTQKLTVAAGNENILDFYRQFGFYPLHIVMQRRFSKIK